MSVAKSARVGTSGAMRAARHRAGLVVSRLDDHVRSALPRPLYYALVRRYHAVRVATGAGAGRGRLLPDFVIIGTVKSGTTSLYEWLGRHPFVAPARQKEVHFFDYNYHRGEGWYRRHFPKVSERLRFAAEHGRPFITGEASPSYIAHAWAPQRMAAMLPQVKLLVIMRNPVDRAYSQYQMSVRENQEPLEFARAIALEEERLAPEQARMRADPFFSSWPIGCWSYQMRSRYAEQIERWLNLFHRSQLHFLTLEELAREPQRVLDGVHEFLGIPAHTYADLQPLHVASYDAIDPSIRAELTEYFRPHNKRLYELIGRDLGWEA